MEHFKQRVATWLEPIPGPSPGGIDARYDPGYESIRQVIISMDTPTGPSPDWEEVLRESDALLTSKSKDLLIAGHAAYGLYRLEGLEGLAAGLWMLAELMDRYWDTSWPALKRIRGRVNAVDWLTSRVNVTLPETPVGERDHDVIAALKRAADRLAEVTRARFEDQAPVMQALLDNVKRLELSLPPRPEPDAPATDTTVTQPPKDEAAPIAVRDSAEARRSPDQPAGQPPSGTSGTDAADAPSDAEHGELATKLTKPISGDAPAGQDARYDDVYEEMRLEVAQLTSPTGGAVDWEKVERIATELLSTRTKDILVASYLAGAMYERRGLEGLLEGLKVVTAIIDVYWDTGFPAKARMRGRAAALQWLLLRLDRLAEVQIKASDRVCIAGLEDATERFKDVVTRRYDDQAPAIGPLLENVRRLALSLPAEKEQAPPQPSPPTGALAGKPADPAAPKPRGGDAAKPAEGGEALKPPDVPKELTDLTNLKPFLLQVGVALQEAAATIFKADKADPLSYKLNRLGALTMFDGSLHIKQGAQTSISAPPTTMLEEHQMYFETGEWESLLISVEGYIRRRIVWLDLQRLATAALSNLGHEAARVVVETMTMAIVRLFPQLRDLKFKDGRPFADAATQAWLDEVILAGSEGQKEDGGGGLTPDEGAVLSKARSLALEGKSDEALALLASMSESARNMSVRFHARLAMAEVCTMSGALSVADALYTELHETIDLHHLERWDLMLPTRTYEAHLEVLAKLKDAKSGRREVDDKLEEKISRVHSRLCRVAPIKALKHS